MTASMSQNNQIGQNVYMSMWQDAEGNLTSHFLEENIVILKDTKLDGAKEVLDNKYIFPSKIIGIGRNYVSNESELEGDNRYADSRNMIVFNKPNTCITNELNAEHGPESEQIAYETEICFMIRDGKFGAVSVGLDLTKKDKLYGEIKNNRLPWERSKAFDKSALFTDFIPIKEVSDNLNFTLEEDGLEVQNGSIPLMIYKPDHILQELKTFTTLLDGDIVMTGTPIGVDTVKAGKTYKVTLKDGDEVIV